MTDRPGRVEPAHRASGGEPLHRRVVPAVGDLQGRVLFVHGFAEHAARYGAFAEALAARGVEVHLLDLPGHGESPGVRALIDDVERVASDVAALACTLANDGSVPVGLVGHSLGGATVLRAAQLDEGCVRAVATTGPYLQSALEDPAWLLSLASGLSRVFPTLRSKPIDAGAVSNEPHEVAAYDRDPLVDRGGVRLASIRELHAIGPRVLTEAARLTVPTLVMQGDADALSDPQGARALAKANAQVDVRIVAGGAHDLLHDTDRSNTTHAMLTHFVEHGVAQPV